MPVRHVLERVLSSYPIAIAAWLLRPSNARAMRYPPHHTGGRTVAMNGRLPDSLLTKIPGGRLRRGAAARSWLAMRYYIGRKTGIWLRPTGPASSYRTLGKQRAFYAAYQAGRGPLAAIPGTSNHGLGLAVDIPTAEMQAAVRKYGHLFGWGIRGGQLASDAPTEAWHCTYRGPYTRLARRWFWRRRLTIRKGNR